MLTRVLSKPQDIFKKIWIQKRLPLLKDIIEIDFKNDNKYLYHRIVSRWEKGMLSKESVADCIREDGEFHCDDHRQYARTSFPYIKRTKYVNDIVKYTNDFINNLSDNSFIHLIGPMGSGKSIIIDQYIDHFIKPTDSKNNKIQLTLSFDFERYRDLQPHLVLNLLNKGLLGGENIALLKHSIQTSLIEDVKSLSQHFKNIYFLLEPEAHAIPTYIINLTHIYNSLSFGEVLSNIDNCSDLSLTRREIYKLFTIYSFLNIKPSKSSVPRLSVMNHLEMLLRNPLYSHDLALLDDLQHFFEYFFSIKFNNILTICEFSDSICPIFFLQSGDSIIEVSEYADLKTASLLSEDIVENQEYDENTKEYELTCFGRPSKTKTNITGKNKHYRAVYSQTTPTLREEMQPHMTSPTAADPKFNLKLADSAIAHEEEYAINHERLPGVVDDYWRRRQSMTTDEQVISNVYAQSGIFGDSDLTERYWPMLFNYVGVHIGHHALIFNELGHVNNGTSTSHGILDPEEEKEKEIAFNKKKEKYAKYDHISFSEDVKDLHNLPLDDQTEKVLGTKPRWRVSMSNIDLYKDEYLRLLNRNPSALLSELYRFNYIISAFLSHPGILTLLNSGTKGKVFVLETLRLISQFEKKKISLKSDEWMNINHPVVLAGLETGLFFTKNLAEETSELVVANTYFKNCLSEWIECQLRDIGMGEQIVYNTLYLKNYRDISESLKKMIL